MAEAEKTVYIHSTAAACRGQKRSAFSSNRNEKPVGKFPDGFLINIRVFDAYFAKNIPYQLAFFRGKGEVWDDGIHLPVGNWGMYIEGQNLQWAESYNPSRIFFKNIRIFWVSVSSKAKPSAAAVKAASSAK